MFLVGIAGTTAVVPGCSGGEIAAGRKTVQDGYSGPCVEFTDAAQMRGALEAAVSAQALYLEDALAVQKVWDQGLYLNAPWSLRFPQGQSYTGVNWTPNRGRLL